MYAKMYAKTLFTDRNALGIEERMESYAIKKGKVYSGAFVIFI
jgi:hypothetical protein